MANKFRRRTGATRRTHNDENAAWSIASRPTRLGWICLCSRSNSPSSNYSNLPTTPCTTATSGDIVLIQLLRSESIRVPDFTHASSSEDARGSPGDHFHPECFDLVAVGKGVLALCHFITTRCIQRPFGQDEQGQGQACGING